MTLCIVQAQTAFSLDVRSLQSHNAELEEMVKYQEGMILELRQTVSACGDENNSLRSICDILANYAACIIIGWHDAIVCLSVCLSV